VTNPNYTGSATNTLTVSPATATVTLGNLNQIYNGTARIVTATTTPSGLSVGITYNGSSTAPTNVGSYQVVGTVTNPNYTGSATNTLTVSPAAASVTLSNLNQIYNGAARIVTATTTPSGLSVGITYDSSSTAPTNAGSYQVVGTVTNPNYTGSDTNTLTVSPAAATVTLSNLNQVYDGTPRVVTATTIPSGLGVSITYDSSTSAPTNAGAYEVVGTVTDINYVAGATNNMSVAKVPLAITADDKSKAFGQLDPAFTANYASFVGGENESILDGTLMFSRVPGEAAGTYAITPAGLTSINYEIGFVDGTLTITNVTPVILSVANSDSTNVVITWSAVSNVKYRVQYRDDFDGEWFDLSPDIDATSDTAFATDYTFGLQQRFYRVVIPLP
jgi:hypothetical protein